MKKQEFTAGLKTGIPIMFGFLPVAIAYAIMAKQSGLTPVQTVLMSLFVFAGASQMMAVGMMTMGAGAFSIILAVFILNLRHVIMSTCVVNRMKNVPFLAKMALSFGITDETFAIYTTMPEEKCTAHFFWGLMTISYSSWVLGAVIGCIASQFLPQVVSDSLGIALYAMFIGLMIPGVRKNLHLLFVVGISALLNLLLRNWISGSYAVIAATLIGSFAGVFLVEDEENTDTLTEAEA